MTSRVHLLLPTLVATALSGLVVWTAARALTPIRPASDVSDIGSIVQMAGQVDAVLQRNWEAAAIVPGEPAGELQIFRRVSLALAGTPPSLEEIREFEADDSSDRLQHWTSRLISDSRFVEYFAARLGDAFVDPESEQLKPHQHQRFTQWLGDSLQKGASYGEMVHEMIAGHGVFVDHPATTFVALELASGDQAAERLAARTCRAFLGQRIDCAQCHHHPFAGWTQPQFEGLAAFYGQVQYRNGRIQDTRPRPFVIDDERRGEHRTIEPQVPFHSEWVPDRKHIRAELAEWVTHRGNRRFRRAIANRVWGLMFGRPLVSPVDDLPDPPVGDNRDVLDVLADELAENGDDLRRLIQGIVATRAFHLASTHTQMDDESAAAMLETEWAVFPLSELTPQQMIRSMQQAATLQTLRSESLSTYTAIRRYERQFRFVEEYGAAGDTEESQSSTIPHTVQRLNGTYTRQFDRATILTAPGRIAAISPDAAACLENCYLACLTRRPTAEEQACFLPQLQGNSRQRRSAVEDIYWTLFNSAEFCWNH